MKRKVLAGAVIAAALSSALVADAGPSRPPAPPPRPAWVDDPTAAPEYIAVVGADGQELTVNGRPLRVSTCAVMAPPLPQTGSRPAPPQRLAGVPDHVADRLQAAGIDAAMLTGPHRSPKNGCR